MITIRKIGPVWVATAPFEAKDILKQVMFRWHPGILFCDRDGCQACENDIDKRWWTGSIDAAVKLVQYADESCREELEKFSGRYDKSFKASTALEADIEVSTKLPLFPFQRAGVKFLEMHDGRALVADEAGCGKSPQAIGYLIRHPEALPALIVAPASIKIQWTRELAKFSDLSGSVLVGKSARRAFEKLGIPIFPDRKTQVVVANYDLLIKNFEVLAQHGFKTLILDEASAIKEPKSQRSKAAIQLSRLARNVILLSGTPLLNRPRELWNLTQAVDPTVFPNFFHFAKKFCNAKQVEVRRGQKVWDFNGASNLSELNEVLRGRLMIRREKKDVLTELPEKIRVIFPIALDKEPKDQAKRLEKLAKNKAKLEEWKEKLATFSDADRKVYLSKHAERAAEMAGMTGVLIAEIQEIQKAVAMAKMPGAIERILELLGEGARKILCFVHHHEINDEVVKQLSAAGVRCVRVDGRDGPAERQKAVDAIQEGNAQVAVLGIMAAGMGLNLTAAQDVVFMELPWRPADVEQCEARAHRKNQLGRVTVYFFVGAGTIEESIAKMLDGKREVTNAAMGEAGRTIQETGILDAILDDLAGAAPKAPVVG